MVLMAAVSTAVGSVPNDSYLLLAHCSEDMGNCQCFMHCGRIKNSEENTEKEKLSVNSVPSACEVVQGLSGRKEKSLGWGSGTWNPKQLCFDTLKWRFRYQAKQNKNLHL